MDTELAKVFAQFGFPAVIAGGLIFWMTRSLNGKLDRLTQGVSGLRDAVIDNSFAVRQNTEKVDGLLRKLD